MIIDYRAEIDKRQEDFLEDLFSLIRINSERDDSQADARHPFGPGPVKALEHFLTMAERDGYKTTNVDNYAGHFEFGQGEEVLGIFAHLDVVPAGSGWDTNPYEPVIKDDKLYARGSSDDKGPTIAAYYALKIIKELNLPVSKKVRFVIGTDEESGWADMDYYFEHVGLPEPDFGFAPDAEFPIINGEKGNITEYLRFGGENSGAVVLERFVGGLRTNMVPESATALLSGSVSASQLSSKMKTFAAENGLQGTVEEINDQVQVSLVGKSAHGMTPFAGVNGATYLAVFLSDLKLADDAKAFVDVAAQTLHKDFYGEKLGVSCRDVKMGELTMNAGIFDFKNGASDNQIALNFRYPKGTNPELIKAELEKLSGVKKVTVDAKGHVPHYVPAEDPLVTTLLDVYERHTGVKGEEQIIGGGTFGRLLKRGVAFGAMFPGYTNTMHQANEFVDIEDLYRAAAIYAEAIYELIK
ncbi:dipeptidase PepV [Streptococcus dentiloxodontae]